MKIVACALVIAARIASPAAAGELRVGGYLDLNANIHTGPIVLFGDRGFTFQSRVVDFGGIFEPGDCNAGGGCSPGAVVSLHALWSGLDLIGTATLDSTTFPDVGGFNSRSSMFVEFSGAAILPPLTAGPTTIVAPFSLSGVFRHPEAASETLFGIGTATLFLSPAINLHGVWHVDRVVYRLASAVPPPWATQDIGVVGISGSAGYVDGTFYIQGDGGDVWGSSDAFRFVYQPAAGDADIVARVTAQQASDPFAKIGVMFRQSLDPSSLQVILDRRPTGDLEFMVRSGTGESTAFIAGGSSALPTWLRLARSGRQFVAYQSMNGTTWNAIGSIDIPAAGFTVLAGLAVTSHDGAALSTAALDNVTVRMPVSVHNLLQFGSFEEYVPPDLEPFAWVSDNPLRQVPAKSETNQPHSGKQNGACWTPEFFDCGLYQEVSAPVTGEYTLRVFASADRPGGLVGINLNGRTATLSEVAVRDFDVYEEYTLPFHAQAGDVVRVWMYSPPVPGYVVIDDVSLTLDRPIAITHGSWSIGPGGTGQFGRFTLTGDDVEIAGSYDGGVAEPGSDCSATRCQAGQLVALRSFFENQTPLTIESFARGTAVVGGVTYPLLEFGGALVLSGQTVSIPAPGASGEHVRVSAPFTIAGDLKGFDVLGRRTPLLVFDVPMTGHGTATLELVSEPSASGPMLSFLQITYSFEP